ncbi:Hypothetical predicted protein [Mytilus galloprovincialis]|uniref:Uncharacterized protein n=1 Tax=Mytilus galloprovincialis TaxID=29158 RepID=A0A8B6EZY4_MYTGA|nr:Hypothetical predicted protein [Mytilus galloprovincialis]
MGKFALLVLVVAITMINQYKGEPNFVCTRRGGHCSNSHTCPSSGGNVEKLSVRCRCRKACCKCTDKCPVGSTCMSEGKACDGTKDTNGCCGNRFCCTPTPTPPPCIPTCAGYCPKFGFCDFGDNEHKEGCCGSICCTKP